MLRIFFAILFIFCANTLSAQKSQTLRSVVTQGDTLPQVFLREVVVQAKTRSRKWYDRYNRRNTRLEYNVRKVYPYALLAAAKITEIEEQLAHTTKESERKAIIREEYARLMKTFKTPLTKLSVTQGRILVRLIYRETNHTSFAHIREYKGAVNAYFWQSLALLFGNNLKAAYDPYGEDAEIEEIVQRIQQK
ncbi:DUF4294 domain-containing protein [Odoribacter sp. Z80]|uniref:DUF4294 domain-containing protein n=1 Tax=Odoribacter sp. Z80 TaxID=2304575 RepID=UPI00137AEEE2|nr:DUF4294 domain-containing protein [Odoribacter sp. Z80]NCE71541.1 DUF4294 domain-containing protein [Odoribacter sp. Z80]